MIVVLSTAFAVTIFFVLIEAIFIYLLWGDVRYLQRREAVTYNNTMRAWNRISQVEERINNADIRQLPQHRNFASG